jgi:hypothetical protein
MPRSYAVSVSGPTNCQRVSFHFDPVSNTSFSELVRAKQLDIIRQIHSTNASIHSTLETVRRLDLYPSFVEQLRIAGIYCLDSDSPDMTYGEFALLQVQQDFLSACGSLLRSVFIKKVSRCAAVVGIPAAAMSLVTTIFWSYSNSIIKPLDWVIPENVARWTSGYACVILGACIGVWLSYMLRNRTLSWSSLTLFDPDGLSPATRLAIVASITTILCILLGLNVIIIGVGNVQLGDYLDDHRIAILLGLIGGISEDAVTKIVIGRVGQVVSAGTSTNVEQPRQP